MLPCVAKIVEILLSRSVKKIAVQQVHGICCTTNSQHIVQEEFWPWELNMTSTPRRTYGEWRGSLVRGRISWIQDSQRSEIARLTWPLDEYRFYVTSHHYLNPSDSGIRTDDPWSVNIQAAFNIFLHRSCITHNAMISHCFKNLVCNAAEAAAASAAITTR